MIDDYLRRHDGVITLDQARAAGLTLDGVKHRVRSGRWRRCSRGVYFAEDRPFTDAARVRAAVWSYGRNATASGLAAAWWHGLMAAAPGVVEVTAPRSSRGRSRPGSRVRRRDLKLADMVERRGLQVTSMELTALEAAVRPGGGPAVMDRALQRHTQLSPLWQAHMRNTGRHGSPRARILLQAAGDNGHSQAERLLIRLFKHAGVTGWVANHAVGPYLVDNAFPTHKVAIEIDGFAFHTDAEVFQYDRDRQNYLVLNGWLVLRFTWRDLMEHPDRVIAEVRRVTSAR